MVVLIKIDEERLVKGHELASADDHLKSCHVGDQGRNWQALEVAEFD